MPGRAPISSSANGRTKLVFRLSTLGRKSGRDSRPVIPSNTRKAPKAPLLQFRRLTFRPRVVYSFQPPFTDRAVQVATTNRRLISEDQIRSESKINQRQAIKHRENTNRRNRHESTYTEHRTATINQTPDTGFRRFPCNKPATSSRNRHAAYGRAHDRNPCLERVKILEWHGGRHSLVLGRELVTCGRPRNG